MVLTITQKQHPKVLNLFHQLQCVNPPLKGASYSFPEENSSFGAGDFHPRHFMSEVHFKWCQGTTSAANKMVGCFCFSLTTPVHESHQMYGQRDTHKII